MSYSLKAFSNSIVFIKTASDGSLFEVKQLLLCQMESLQLHGLAKMLTEVIFSKEEKDHLERKEIVTSY